MNLPELIDKLHSEQACREHLAAVRWPDGVRCPDCGFQSISYIKTRHIYECNNCRRQFSVKSGTIFHDSHLPLRTWFLAIHRIVESKKGVSANQLKRELGISYQTAWYMCHRIREAMKDHGDNRTTLWGIVEADETYVKGKGLPKGEKLKSGTGSQRHTAVLGLKERGGKVRAKAVDHASMPVVTKFIKQNTGNQTQAIYTDESKLYNLLKGFTLHESVNHSVGYVMGDVHTNGIESFWSLLKRGIVGQYHRVSAKHLQRYVDEFCWRQNLDKESDLFHQALTATVNGEHIKYSERVHGQ